MAKERSNNALQVIFSFFLGLMVTAFVGVGVYTFYPPPEERLGDQLQELYRQQEDIQGFKEQSQVTDADRAKLRTIQLQIRELEDEQQASREVWGRNTSIILITFATLVMSVSLIRAEQLRVISNGLLLGGLFTMVYGIGWVIATGTSQVRFWVMTVALVITLGLGYIKFVPNREQGQLAPVSLSTSGEVAADAGALAALSARVESLEARTAAAASALGVADEDRRE